ncbi:uncharacterized protein LOC121592710 isoform X2 [Anopheles merus]|uniref:Uncharacterized protein n=3 Tax=gambiae species complex TaxID=44542 RepID=A0A6E8VTI4_ANOCL|nr:uncharacterized protein LOC5667141 [Anopheles gambiae]XP_040229107.2 uncharacterized protein LOC120953340 [Anopheles coluzzii]XP_041770358.1 uncharacterized protein LOC121592710 isoform X2 [Anopheles merus]XP_041770359.1 uncharacterized protein LOC121592710 isoform X2 [Anopheles merus]XP_049466900.1 uncharacterized protein LOC120953340 [Anopheles coluzzii]XP_061507563.1 uncharacterized protein LOC5667141 [Anopheles gambiae]
MIIFLYLILVLAWALLIIILKCKKARAKRLAEQEEMAQPVHVVQIGSNLYDIMSLHRDNYSGVYSCLEHGTIAQHRQRASASVTHSNAAFVGDDGSIYPGNGMVALEPPPSYEEVIRLPAYYPKVETFVPEMVVPPSTGPRPHTVATQPPPVPLHQARGNTMESSTVATISPSAGTGTPAGTQEQPQTDQTVDANGNRIKGVSYTGTTVTIQTANS